MNAISILTLTPVLGYIGPGMGAGLFGTILGIIAAILMLIFGALWYPLKKLYRKLFKAKPAPPANRNDGHS